MNHSYVNGLIDFLQNSRILQPGILQTGPNQFVENQKQNQDNTGRFGMKNLPKRLEFFLPKRPVPDQLTGKVAIALADFFQA